MKRLRDIVLKHMVHGPCGSDNPTAPCMYNRNGDLTQVCSKGFPKKFVAETFVDPKNSYVTYQRRVPGCGEHEALVHDRPIDNGWIVPFSPYLSLKYDCHINVEVCASTKAAKYLHKYVGKGGDRAMVNVS